MQKVGEFMGVPVYSSPAVPKNEMFILSTKDLNGATGIKLKRHLPWGTILTIAFFTLGVIATYCLFMWALVWSW